MSNTNYIKRTRTHKIVYAGSVSTSVEENVRSLYKTIIGRIDDKDSHPLVELSTEPSKTLFFDTPEINCSSKFKSIFSLYTVPLQVYYNATRKLVLRGVDGVVFAVDARKEKLLENLDAFDSLKQSLQEIEIDILEIPLVFQYVYGGGGEYLSIDDLNKFFKVPAIEWINVSFNDHEGVIQSYECVCMKIMEKEKLFWGEKIVFKPMDSYSFVLIPIKRKYCVLNFLFNNR